MSEISAERDEGLPAVTDQRPDEEPPPVLRRRLEVVALLLTGAVVAALVTNAILAFDADDSSSFVDRFRMFSATGADKAIWLLIAFGLVALAPGTRLGRAGAVVLNAVSVVGVLFTGMLLVAAHWVVSMTLSDHPREGPAVDVALAGPAVRTVRYGLAAGTSLVLLGAVALGIAWMSWRMLNEQIEEFGSVRAGARPDLPPDDDGDSDGVPPGAPADGG